MDFQDLEKSIKAELGRATADKRHPWRYPVLASVEGGEPQQRILVLRKFEIQPWIFWFYSDKRSAKISQIEKQARVSQHFYHPRKQMQLRVQGDCRIELQNEISNAELLKIPKDQRGDYQTAQAPGAILSQEAIEMEGSAERNFCVLRLRAQSIDYLKLSREGHTRAKGVVSPTGDWLWQVVQP